MTAPGQAESGSASSATALVGERLLQHRLAPAELCHDGVGFLSVVGDSAVRDIIAIPTSRRIERIELRKIDRGNPAGHAVHEHPPATLPLPARRRIVGKIVIQAECAPHDKQTIGDFVRRPGHVFLDAPVHQQRANFEDQWLFFRSGRKPLRGSPFTEGNDVNFRARAGDRRKQHHTNNNVRQLSTRHSHNLRLGMSPLLIKDFALFAKRNSPKWEWRSLTNGGTVPETTGPVPAESG